MTAYESRAREVIEFFERLKTEDVERFDRRFRLFESYNARHHWWKHPEKKQKAFQAFSDMIHNYVNGKSNELKDIFEYIS